MALPPLDQIIATFDKLVAEEIVAYGPYQKIEKDCDGYPVSDGYQLFLVSHQETNIKRCLSSFIPCLSDCLPS